MADDDGEDTLRQLLGDAYPAVLRFSVKLTRNLADAEDVAQEACLRAWKHRQRYFQREDAKVVGWLVSVAKRIVIDRARARRSQLQRGEAAVPDEQLRLAIPNGEVSLGRARAAHGLRRVLDGLDEVDRGFLGVWAEQRQRNVSREVAAEEMNMTMSEYEAAKKRLRRQVKVVAEQLGVDVSVVLWADEPSVGSGQ